MKIVTIVGRPNVGKSSLFNALLKKNRAVHFYTPGVTRDVVTDTLTDGEKAVELRDSGGFDPKIKPSKIVDKIWETIWQSELLLFVVSAKEGLTPADEEIAQLIRRTGKKVWLIINKVDGPKEKEKTYEFVKLGFKKVFETSIPQKKGISYLRKELLAELGQPFREENNTIKWGIYGRPNVGKSSLLNAIIGFERAIVTEVPGTTRDSFYVKFKTNRFTHIIYDTAGLRRKAKVKEHLEKICGEHAIELLDSIDLALLLCDATEGMTHQDKQLLHLITSRFRGFIIGLNKIDLLSPGEISHLLKKIEKESSFAGHAPVLPLSAITGKGVERLLSEVEELYQRFTSRISTGKLNRFIEKEISIRGVKLYYATQVQTAPPVIVLFVNRKELMKKEILKYLRNRLQEYFGLQGVPIKFKIKDKEDVR